MRVKERELIGLLLILAFASYWGFRPLHVGTDTLTYVQAYSRLAWHPISGFNNNWEVGYNLFMYLLHTLRFGAQAFLFFSIFLALLLVHLGIRAFGKYYLLILILILLNPATLSMSINIIRSGVAFGLFVSGAAALISGRRRLAVGLLLMSIGFHVSALFYVLLTLILFSLINLKFRTLCSVTVAFFGLTSFLVLQITVNFDLVSAFLGKIPAVDMLRDPVLIERRVAHALENHSPSRIGVSWIVTFIFGFAGLMIGLFGAKKLSLFRHESPLFNRNIVFVSSAFCVMWTYWYWLFADTSVVARALNFNVFFLAIVILVVLRYLGVRGNQLYIFLAPYSMAWVISVQEHFYLPIL